MEKKILTVCLAFGMLAAGAARAGSFLENRAGIGLRGSYWSMQDDETMIRVDSHSNFNSSVEVGGGGGWITFFSGVGGRGSLEFSLGAVGRAETVQEGLFWDKVDVTGAMPILLGYQYSLFRDAGTSAFQPYVSAGGGPYILTKVHVKERMWLDDEVSVKNKVRPGAYGAMGGYFVFSHWFALQGEMRYHLVGFDPDNAFSGVELGLGVAFFWKR